MRPNNMSRAIAALCLCGAAAGAHAANFTFSGNVVYNTDVIQIAFTLNNDATNVAVWTDSFMSGTNYDPITALWHKVGGNYEFIAENDDDDTIAPGQTYYDSGFQLPTLAAGEYLFTVAAYDNFHNGPLLSDGFGFAGQTPIAIPDWCQPASNNCTNQKGTFWRVNLSGVDSAEPPPVPSIPEPSTYALMMLGMGALGWAARRQKKG